MLLVPRQLQRAGMTGDVAYYGGRLTPAQAYAASHPRRPASARPSPAPAEPVAGVRAPVPSEPLAPAKPRVSSAEQLQALRQLVDSGVLSPAEYDALRARVRP